MPGREIGAGAAHLRPANRRAGPGRAASRASRSAVWCRWRFRFFWRAIFRSRWLPRFDSVSALQGLVVGLLTVLLFTIPPLLGIRHIRPALIFRREMAAPPAGVARMVEARGGFRYLGVADPGVRRTARGVAERERANRRLFRHRDGRRTGGRWRSWRGCCCARCAGSAVICRARAGPVVRQGIANLYRPGQSCGRGGDGARAWASCSRLRSGSCSAACCRISCAPRRRECRMSICSM